MAYVEVRKEGKLVMQKQVDDELAQKGFRIRVGTAGNVFLKLGENKTVGDYVVTLYKGQPSEDAYHAVDDLKKAAGAITPINTPNAQNVTVSADAGDAGRAGEQKKYPQIEGFEITGRLGEGGMGTVWRGVQLSTKREVAIKFLSTHRFTSQKAKTRFEREVAMAAKLNHPNIAQVYDSGVHRGVYYYAMELIEGIHLDKYVQREELSPREVVKLMRDVCDAVCHAHQHGIIHRDLKPSNILVTPFGKPTIVDFGLAKSFENEHEDATISIEGDITGTPAYMAPEQAAGRIKDISERTDVYAMGVIMFQLTAGCLPHDISGSHYDIFRRIVEEDVISPRTINPGIDNELDSILLTCLAREPENRYPSASVLVKDIDNYLSGQPLLSKSFSTTYRVVKQFRRNRFKIALGGIFAAMLAAIILLLCFIYSSLSPDGPTKSTSQQNNQGSTKRIIDSNQSLAANKGSQPNSQQDKQGSTEVVIDRDKPVTTNKGSEPKAGEVITNSIGMKLVYIPAGQFQMGSPLSAEEVVKKYGGQIEWFNNTPIHPVKITHGFYMGQMEITVDQFREFVKATGYETTAQQRGKGHTFSVVQSEMVPVQGLNWRNPGIEQGTNHPVILVSRFDAVAFCRWLSKKENKNYRLPTEAQWEYACRAGSQTEFYWGNEAETSIAYANMCDQSAQKWADNQGGSFSFALKSDDRVATTAPVGSFKPNAFGLYDMHGNVWEWCADWYGSDYYTQSPAENPHGPDIGDEYIIRGGTWYYYQSCGRAAYRGKLKPGAATIGTGFRVCLFDGQTPPRPREADKAVVEQNIQQQLDPNTASFKYGLYLHFDISTFAGYIGAKDIGKALPERYAPTNLDVRSWIRMARQAGMDFAVLAVKHEAGFCLWDSEGYDYDVASSPVKTDVVAQFVNACKAEGIKAGVHYSIPDARSEGKVSYQGPVGQVYFDRIKKHMVELHTKYPDIRLQLFDCSARLSQEQLRELSETVKRLNPQCVIWGAKNENLGTNFGCNTLNNGWIWSPDAQFMSAHQIFEQYSITRSKGLPYLLNAAPDRSGRIPEQYVAVLMELKGMIEQKPPQSISLQRNLSPAAISIHGKPFFVICARSAVPEEFEEYKQAGFNTVQTHLPSNPALDEAQKHGLYAIHRFADYKGKEGLFLPEFWQEIQTQITTWESHPALLAWEQSADLLLTHKNPSEIKNIFDLLSTKSPDKPRLLSYDFNDNNWKQFNQYTTYTDVVILENFSIRKNISATALWFQRAFELADGRPIWYTVHANIWQNKSPSVRELRAAAYLGINHGATGVLIDGFQDQLWKEWGVGFPGLADPRLADLRKEAIRVAGELKTLSPAILAGSLKDSPKLSGNSQIDFQAFTDPDNTTLYLIAVNPSNQIVTSSFYVPQDMVNPIEVLNENRTIPHNTGVFTDTFEQNETHIYIWKYSQKNSLNSDNNSPINRN